MKAFGTDVEGFSEFVQTRDSGQNLIMRSDRKLGLEMSRI